MSSREWWKNIVKKVIIEDADAKSIKNPGENLLDKMSEYAFNEFCKAECWELYPECRLTLENLSKRNIKLGIISNFDERIRVILNELDLSKYFNFVVTPHDNNGLAKPNAEIFRFALTKSGFSSPNQITHIGNHIDEDYFAAKNAGFNAILISHDQSVEDDPRLQEIKRKGHFISSFNSLLND